jgi:aryl-alcohol dehydrogenase-like predicted oxidoreductase
LGFQEAADAWPEIAPRFTIWQDGAASAIVGTTKQSHVERNLDFVSKRPLSDSTVKKLREAFQRAQTATGEKWVAQN